MFSSMFSTWKSNKPCSARLDESVAASIHLSKWIIKVAGSFAKYFAKIIAMMEQIGDILPLYERYEQMFDDSVPFREALANMYFDVVLFLCKARTIFKTNGNYSMLPLSSLIRRESWYNHSFENTRKVRLETFRERIQWRSFSISSPHQDFRSRSDICSSSHSAYRATTENYGVAKSS